MGTSVVAEVTDKLTLKVKGQMTLTFYPSKDSCECREYLWAAAQVSMGNEFLANKNLEELF